MSLLMQDELQDFADSIEGVVERHWENPRIAGEDADGERLTALWAAAASHGWLALAEEDAADALIAANERLGWAACPLPLTDVYVAVTLLKDDPSAERVASGEIRPVVVPASEVTDGRTRYVEAGGSATHVLIIDDAAEKVQLRPISTAQLVAGMAEPKWSDVTIGEDVTAEVVAPRADIESAKALVRLSLVARAVSAASRSHELALEHAKTRTAFGKVIGSFQAVSHRAVNSAADLAATKSLIQEALKARAAGSASWQLASELAVAYGRKTAIGVQFDAAHTLAAQGYFEEHEAPWLFRRLHADTVRLDLFELAAGEPADMLLEAGMEMPQLELGPEAEAFRAEVRQFLEPYVRPDEAVNHMDDEPDDEFIAEAARRGYITMSWPTEYGGKGASVEEQMVLGEELAYNRVSLNAKGMADMLGTAIIRHGTEAQQQRFLPMLADGTFRSYLGYSEPEVGSDLANLKSRAVRDGDEWVVNARKSWGTGAHRADYVWLAVRTDPEATPPHAGITVFLTKCRGQEGWELQKHRALSGEISCSTFFDDMRVPDADRVGEVNGGWKVITEALAQERVIMANNSASILRLFKDLLDEARKDIAGIMGPRGSAKRSLITSLAARIQAARVLVMDSVRATAKVGGGARLEAPMAKIISSALFEDFGEATLEIFGPAAALGENVPGVPGNGAFEYNLRYSIMHVVGGGSIDIQRNLVARALGLPR